jgi:hypothetical protein
MEKVSFSAYTEETGGVSARAGRKKIFWPAWNRMSAFSDGEGLLGAGYQFLRRRTPFAPDPGELE